MPIPEYMSLDEAIYAVQNKMVCGMNDYWLDYLSRWLPELRQLRETNARLEKEADWLAQSAANNGWHGVRVSPSFMHEKARRAVEEQYPPYLQEHGGYKSEPDCPKPCLGGTEDFRKAVCGGESNEGTMGYPLAWTTKFPRVPGFYFVRNLRRHAEIYVQHYTQSNIEQFVSIKERILNEEFAGPIPMPL